MGINPESVVRKYVLVDRCLFALSCVSPVGLSSKLVPATWIGIMFEFIIYSYGK
jgi:hypothetical protein